jgi:hypothetical protein
VFRLQGYKGPIEIEVGSMYFTHRPDISSIMPRGGISNAAENS